LKPKGKEQESPERERGKKREKSPLRFGGKRNPLNSPGGRKKTSQGENEHCEINVRRREQVGPKKEEIGKGCLNE